MQNAPPAAVRAGAFGTLLQRVLMEGVGMTLLSLLLISLWMVLLVLGWTFAGFVHALAGAAVTLVLLTGKRGTRRARVAAAATAAAAAASSLPNLPMR